MSTMGEWTFGRKIALGFAAVVALALVIGITAVLVIRSVVAAKDRVITVNARILIEVEELRADAERKVVGTRSYLLTGEERFNEMTREARAGLRDDLQRLKELVATGPNRELIDRIDASEAAHELASEAVVAMRRAGRPMDEVVKAFDREPAPRFDQLRRDITALTDAETKELEAAKHDATAQAERMNGVLIALTLAALACAATLAWLLAGAITRQVGAAVQNIQSSSTELQAAANQQATGAKQQASAMTEITTTLKELLSTSRQIAESAQRVAQIASDTAAAARSGDQVVHRTQDSVSSIKRQVDLIVAHMLDLGRKSQQIGGILELINELAEQTNILAINATIEAVGAGETGRRFAAVADEIRKLADRVGGSTKEIRTLIDEIRSAVNTTVMATEGGSKAVDAGTRQFGDVAASLKQIVGLVGTTTEAAREIELSTKQQSTAVEQVTVAVADVAQATKETEATSGQVLRTSSELGSLSRDLLRMVQRRASA
jgi:methyl-accepting chemotaxis protein